MKYSDSYIDNFRKSIKELGFVGCEFIDDLTNEQIRLNINGIGSAGMNATLRKALDNLHPSLVYASHVHDLQWVFKCDGSDSDFHDSNCDFKTNGIIMARHMYSWYNPIRYIASHKARQFRKILDEFGYTAYMTSERIDK